MKDDDPPRKIAKGATLYSKRGTSKKTRKRKSKKVVKNSLLENQPDDTRYVKDIITFLRGKGTRLSFYKRSYLIRRIRSRIGRTSSINFKDYYNYLKTTPEEVDQLIESLSINVTRFYRNEDSWQKIQELVIKPLSKEKKRVRLWSAGCAVGAEPYTLAMLADNYPDTKFQIIASDINDELLLIAKNAAYDVTYLKEMPNNKINNYFDLIENDVYKVKRRLTNRVRFSKLDLTLDKFPQNLDLIVCRNVMIYMEREAQNKIMRKFHQSLITGGHLVLGRTEMLSAEWRDKFEKISVKHRIYKKIK